MGFIKKLIHGHRHHDKDRDYDEESGLLSDTATAPNSFQEDRTGELTFDNTTSQRREQFRQQNSTSDIISGIQEKFQDTVAEIKDDFNEIVIGGSKGPKRDMSYDQSSHITVLLRMYGSVWPKVLPYCLANVVWTLIIHVLSTTGTFDLTLHSNAAHTFMSTLVSFLVVSRSNITYARFMESRMHLGEIFTACRQLVQLANTFTLHDHSTGAQHWRKNLAYETIVMLRTAISVVDYQSNDAPTFGDQKDHATKSQQFDMTEWFHSERTMVDENFRAPSILADRLRATVMKHKTKDVLNDPLVSAEQMALIGKIGDFVKAFGEVKKLMTTPFPFPLVQMTRWFLFAWIFTLPMTLTEAMTYISETMVVVFFITYGFLGIEYVSIELDDPYGNDPSDFDYGGMAEITIEDIYFSIVKADGRETGLALRRRIAEYVSHGNALEVYRRNVCEPSFWSNDED